jgi:hypothetical protein
MGLRSRRKVLGEPCDTETVKHGSEGGGWKSAHRGNSPATYPTSRPVRRGAVGKVPGIVWCTVTRLLPTLLHARRHARHQLFRGHPPGCVQGARRPVPRGLEGIPQRQELGADHVDSRDLLAQASGGREPVC